MKKIIFSIILLLCMIVGFVQFRNIKEIAASLFSSRTENATLIATEDVLPANIANGSSSPIDTSSITKAALDSSSINQNVATEKVKSDSIASSTIVHSVSKAEKINTIKLSSRIDNTGKMAEKASITNNEDLKISHSEEAITSEGANTSTKSSDQAEEVKTVVNNHSNVKEELKTAAPQSQSRRIASNKAAISNKKVIQEAIIKPTEKIKGNDFSIPASENIENNAPNVTIYASVITPKSEAKTEIIKAYINEKLVPSEPEKSAIAVEVQENQIDVVKTVASVPADTLTAIALPNPNKVVVSINQTTLKTATKEATVSSTASEKTIVTKSSPNISYNYGQNFTVGMPINPLVPVNTGSAIPANIYGYVSTIAGGGSNGDSGSKNGISLSARFYYPYSSVVDTKGNIYVTDQGNSIIRKITPTGLVSTLAGSGTAGYADGVGTAASFSNPKGLAIDTAGNIYVADAVNNRIRKVTNKGVVTTVAGNGISGFIDGAGTQASFYNPSAIAIDAAGNLYVADEKNHAIRKISPTGEVNTLAGSGTAGAKNGTGAEASFNYPSGIALDVSGNVYVADFSNQKIRKITPDGLVSTVAGTGAIGRLNGSGKVASFHNPTGITIDNSGNLYIADAGNHQIRKISNQGIVSTLPCTESQGLITNSATNTGFYNPSGVMADTKGSIYVTDQNNNRIRKIGVTGYTISPALPSGLLFDSATGTVSGTPTIASELTEYIITAYNNNGSSTTTLKLATLSPTGAATASNPNQ